MTAEPPPSQPTWAVAFDADGLDAGPPPSRFVALTVTLDLEVLDEDALRAAAVAVLPPGVVADDVLIDPSACLAWLVRAPRLLADLPGVVLRSSSAGTGPWWPESSARGAASA